MKVVFFPIKSNPTNLQDFKKSKITKTSKIKKAKTSKTPTLSFTNYHQVFKVNLPIYSQWNIRKKFLKVRNTNDPWSWFFSISLILRIFE